VSRPACHWTDACSPGRARHDPVGSDNRVRRPGIRDVRGQRRRPRRSGGRRRRSSPAARRRRHPRGFRHRSAATTGQPGRRLIRLRTPGLLVRPGQRELSVLRSEREPLALYLHRWCLGVRGGRRRVRRGLRRSTMSSRRAVPGAPRREWNAPGRRRFTPVPLSPPARALCRRPTHLRLRRSFIAFLRPGRRLFLHRLAGAGNHRLPVPGPMRHAEGIKKLRRPRRRRRGRDLRQAKGRA
jgi:hypothetical protein